MAAFNDSGELEKTYKFPTNKDYQQFLGDLGKALVLFRQYEFKAACCAIAGKVDREKGVGLSFGNLPWTNVGIANDVSRLLNGVKVYVENDAKAAALFQFNVIGDFKGLLYIAPGTGVGIAFIKNGVNDQSIDDLGGRTFMLDINGQKVAWDDISSGRALSAKYGKKAAEIEDPDTWRDYVKGLAQGIGLLIKAKSPDVVVIGGGVGAHLDKFQGYLEEELKKNASLPKIPPIFEAKRSEEAVIYGCYQYAKNAP